MISGFTEKYLIRTCDQDNLYPDLSQIVTLRRLLVLLELLQKAFSNATNAYPAAFSCVIIIL